MKENNNTKITFSQTKLAINSKITYGLLALYI